MFGPLHATFQPNDSTSPYSPVTLSDDQCHLNWYQNVESSHVHHQPSVKEIGQQISECKPILNMFFFFFFHKITSVEFSPLNINHGNII